MHNPFKPCKTKQNQSCNPNLIKKPNKKKKKKTNIVDLHYAPSSQIGLRTCAIGIKHEIGASTNHPILVRLRGWGGSDLRERERGLKK